MLTDEMKAQGWIEHDGGPCPVPEGTYVSIMYRDGKSTVPDLAEFMFWQHDPYEPSGDIIAYRLKKDAHNG